MKIYLSGFSSMKKYLTVDIQKIQFGLSAFPELIKAKDIEGKLCGIKDIFLDSGGFSIRNNGLKLNVNDYAEFIKKNGKRFTVMANMDTSSTEETLEHQEFLEKTTGQFILPVYHMSEFRSKDRNLLEKYCEKYPYVALGGVAGVSKNKKEIMAYLSYCFSIAKKTKTKIHGFGITSDFLIKNFPFYSVDSTSWLSGLRFMTVDYFKNGTIFSMNAGKYRKLLGIDIAYMPKTEKIKRSMNAWLSYNDYITKLHQVKGMEYRD